MRTPVKSTVQKPKADMNKKPSRDANVSYFRQQLKRAEECLMAGSLNDAEKKKLNEIILNLQQTLNRI